MSTLRIKDAPLLPDVDGSEKIPTGGRGDYAVSIDQLKTFAQGSLPQQLEDHINDVENPHNVTKDQVGLGNVDNTSDLDKPISTATQTALNTKANTVDVENALNLKADLEYVNDALNLKANTEDVDAALNLKADKTYVDSQDNLKLDKAEKGSNNGVATLDSSGKVPADQLPSYVDDVIEATTDTLPLVGEGGKIYITTDTNRTWRWSGTQYVEISNGGVSDSTLKLETARNINGIAFDGTQDITIPKANIGLGNVDNTSDLNKPISTATQTALNLKADTDTVKRGIANRYDPLLTYNIGERVVLTNGDIVKSTINGNANNPNSDMTGWEFSNSPNSIITVDSVAEMLTLRVFDGLTVRTKSYNEPTLALSNPYHGGMTYVYASSRSSENDGGSVIDGWVALFPKNQVVNVDWFGADPTGNLDSTQAIKNAISSISTRTTSPFIETKPTCAVEYSAGVYKQGDVPLVSCVEYRGQGSTVTQIIPSDSATYLFKTVGSEEGAVISSATRLCYNTIIGMTLGYGYVQHIPMVNITSGGVYQEASSWCKMRDVNFCGIGGIALRLVGVWDADFTNVTFFNNGYQTNSTTLLIEPVANSNDGSNAITFTRSHFEGNYRHFEIAKNSRHIYFNWAKIEAFTVPSSITDPQGVIFNDLEASTHDLTQPMIGHHSTSDYTPFVVEYNNPVFFGGGYYLYSDANYPVRINGGSSKEAGRIAYGKNFRISDHYGFFCGRTFLDLTDSIVSDCEFANLQSGTADGTLNSVQLSGNSKLSKTIFGGTGNSTDGRAFVSAAPSIPIIDCTFGSGSQYAIRGTPSNKHKNNTAVTTMYSSGGVGLSEIEGFSFGDKSSYKVLATKDTLASISCVKGSSLIQTRAENKLNALLYADSWSGLTLIGKTSSIDIVTTGSTGASGDGKVYIFNTGGTLNIMNRTDSNMEVSMLINSVIT